MKKTLLSFLSFIFVIILVISSLGLSAFASENDDDPQNPNCYVNFFGNISLGSYNSSTASPFHNSTQYTHSDSKDISNLKCGIDVSKYQKSIDWTAVKAAGVSFVFIRVGYTGYVKGTMALDPCFDDYMKGAIAAGLNVGVYYFSQATTVDEAVSEANFAISNSAKYNFDLPLVMDYEFISGDTVGRLAQAKIDGRLPMDTATAICEAFCQTVENAGKTPMIYANKDMLTNTINGAKLDDTYKIWLAHYTTQTDYTGEYEFWQYSSKGTVAGIEGLIDCNFWYQPTSNVSIKGDINGDGKFSIADAKRMLNLIASGISLPQEQINIIDFNSDGKFSIADAKLALAALASQK